ncbi:hypothetical protein ACHAQJ_005587 [Trichoderma viride]
MAPDIAHKLKATLFRRRRRQSSASTTDGLESLSPPTTPGISTSLRRPSFPFPREPSSQTLSLSLELMTGDAGIGIGGCGGGDDQSDAGDSAHTNNDADQQQQRPKHHHQLWRKRPKPKQSIETGKRLSVPDAGTAHEDMAPLASPATPVSPTSLLVAPTTTEVAAPSLPKQAQDVVVGSIEKDKGHNDEYSNGNGNDNDNDHGNGSEQQQETDHNSLAATTDMEAASASAASATSTASATSASTSAALQQRQALTGELQVPPPALDQRQLQRPHHLPASAGARVEGQSPRQSLDGQSQLDGQGSSVINSDQGTPKATSTTGTTTTAISTTAAASASPGAEARITSTGTGTSAGGSDDSSTVVISAGPISGNLQQQRQQQRQVQKRPRQPAPPFPLPSPPATSPPHSQTLFNFPPLAPPTPGPGIAPSLPSLDSIDEDESQSPSHSPSQSQLHLVLQPQSQPQPQSQSQSLSQSQSQTSFQLQQQQQQAPSDLPAAAAATAAAATGRGFDAPSSPGAGHGPLNLNPASPLPAQLSSPAAQVEQLPLQLPVKPSPAPAPPLTTVTSATPISAEKSSLVIHSPARPLAPPRRASRDPNQTVTFDESAAQQLSPSTKRSSNNRHKRNSSDKDIVSVASFSPTATNAVGTPGAETPVSVIVTSNYLAPPTHSSSNPNAPLIHSHLIDVEYSSSIGDDFETSSMAEPTRKIWVARPKASPTLVTINPNDLVDDVRDMILRKYANSLGKTYDSPDLSLRLNTRTGISRILGPEEHMGSVLEEFFPNNIQTVDEAFIIDIPRHTTTPRPSPRAPAHSGGPGSASAAYYADDVRPTETGEGYFPLLPGNATSPRLPTMHSNGSIPHSMTVINSGHLPPIPSPGGTRPRSHRDREQQRHDHQDHTRPAGRNHTPSPNLHNGGGSGVVVPNSVSSSAAANAHGVSHHRPVRHTHSRTHSSSSEHIAAHSSNSMPRSPGHEVVASARMGSGTPPPQRIVSPHLPNARPKKSKRNQLQQQEYPHNPSPPNTVNTTKVPPISVLIVEDNPINLKLLEAFVKRLRVRWQTAMNGREAVKKWRSGGFHLVLMDIQLPGMNGLEATREIRRLERINGIGVFSNAPAEDQTPTLPEEITEQDRLEGVSRFKSPVIIVALTASSLQSDRHEALAAGCNDFLTKPVNFVWLERKVMEWGCMQALIDYEGWREWKQYSAKAEAMEAANKRAQAFKKQSKKNRTQLSAS